MFNSDEMQMLRQVKSDLPTNEPPESEPIPNSSQEFKRLQLELTLGSPTMVLKSAYSLANPKMVHQFKEEYPLYEPIKLYASVPSSQPKDWSLLSFSPLPQTSVFEVEVMAVPGQILASEERDLSSLPSHFDSLVVTNMSSGAEEFLLEANRFLYLNFMVTTEIAQNQSEKCEMCLLCSQEGTSRAEYFKTTVELSSDIEMASVYCQNDNLYLCHNCDKLIHHQALVQHKRLPIGESTRLLECQVHSRMNLTIYDIPSNQFYCENCCVEHGIRIDGTNTIRVSNYAGELELRESRKLEFKDILEKLEAEIVALEEFNEKMVSQYSAIELELLSQFKRMFLDIEREKTLAIEQCVGNVLLMQNMHEQYTRCLNLLIKPSTTSENTFIENVLAIQDLPTINFVEMRQKSLGFESCLKQRVDALEISYIQPIKDNEIQLSQNFERLADLRNYGIEETQPSDKLYKISTRELYVEEKYDTALSQLHSELTYSDIISLMQKETHSNETHEPPTEIQRVDPVDQVPTGIELLEQMLQEKPLAEQSQMNFSMAKTNRYEELFKEIETGPYVEKSFRKLSLSNSQPRENASVPFSLLPKEDPEDQRTFMINDRMALKQPSTASTEPIIPEEEEKLLYSLANGRSYAVLKKLCFGPVTINITLKGTTVVSRCIKMDDFEDEFGTDDTGSRIQTVFNKKFIIIGDVCIFSDFAGAEIGQQQYEVVEFDVLGE